MMCGHAQESIAASWTGELCADEESELRQHLNGCTECSSEMSRLSAMWERLADMPSAEPGRALDLRWRSTLAALTSESKPVKSRFSLPTLWPRQPAWQFAIAAAFLLIGFLIGSRNTEVAKLREEVASTKDMVALSLLQQQSASERLRGVSYTERMPTIEPQVVSALIQAVQHDANVNVRLAAIDALSKVSGNARVRQSLTRSIGEQESPMVQAALIDYVVDARDKHATEQLQQLASRADLNPAIRQRADRALRELTHQ